MQSEKAPLIEVRGLKKYYAIGRKRISQKSHKVYAVDGVDFILKEGETLGLVGESGCGKSTIGKSVVGLERPTQGQILYQGLDLNRLSQKEMKEIRTHIQMIFQDPYTSLNPKKQIGQSIAYPMQYHGFATKSTQEKEVDRLLEMVGLPKNAKERYPYEFSGGQRQRIGIAKALSLKPRFIVCDEPVSALDVSIQAQILNLLRDLQKELNLAYLFIGHGLDAVDYMSDRIAVMYLGKIVEIGPSKEVFKSPIHPYTKALCSAVPIKHPALRSEKKIILQGEIPSNTQRYVGCPFESRCPHAIGRCKTVQPMLSPLSDKSDHLVACLVMNQASQSKGETNG